MRFLKHCSLILVVFCLFLTACVQSDPLEKDDLQDFSPTWSNYQVTSNIIPENFINAFDYIDGYCCHFCYGKSFFSLEVSDRALLFFKYDDETYQQAKNYVFESLELSISPVEEYNGYVFYDNYTGSLSNDFPYSFMRFAYNDSNNTLIFIGCYMSIGFDDNIDELSQNWGAFLNEFYGQWYDFSA